MHRRVKRILGAGAATALAATLSLVAIPGTAHADSPYGPLSLWDNIRYSTGAWQGWIQPSQPPGGMGSAFATASDASDVHVDVVTDSGLWDNIRYASDGTWQGWRQPPQPPGTINELSEAGDPAGNIWFVAYTSAGLYYSARDSQSGAWSSWFPVDHNGAVPGNGIMGSFAVTVDGNNQLQIMMWAGGGTVYHTIYDTTTGAWQNWQEPAQPPGGALSVAAVGLANGSAQFLVTSANGGVYHDIRNANGSWQGWRATSMPSPTGSNESPCCAGAILSAAADEEGNVQFLLTYMDTGNNDRHITYHNIRNANGSWQGWRELLNAGSYCVPKITEQAFDYEDSEAHVDAYCGDWYLFP